MSRTRGPEQTSSDLLLLMNLLGTSCSIPILLWFARRDDLLRSRSRTPSSGKLLTAEGILLFLFGAALAQYLNILLSYLDLFFRAMPQYTESMEQVTGNHGLFWILLWSAVAAPISEELAFRWLVFRRLKDYLPVWPAVIFSSLLFGLYHGNLLQFLYAFFMGIFMAWSMEWTGSLWSCIIFHMGANAWSILMGSEFALWLPFGFAMLILILLFTIILFTPVDFLIILE